MTQRDDRAGSRRDIRDARGAPGSEDSFARGARDAGPTPDESEAQREAYGGRTGEGHSARGAHAGGRHGGSAPHGRHAGDAEPQGDGADNQGDAGPDDDLGDASPGVEQGAQEATDGTALQRELEEQRDRYLRLAAEYDNYRKRSTRERAESGALAQADLVKQLLDALDDLSRFAHVNPETTDARTIVEGVDMVDRKMQKALGAAGLEAINPIDQPFDPLLHEAVATEPALSPEDDHMIARVYQPGYRFNGRLLRPARVVVKQWNG